jgi:hypothetical protein
LNTDGLQTRRRAVCTILLHRDAALFLRIHGYVHPIPFFELMMWSPDISTSLNSREALRNALTDNGVVMLSPIEVHIDTTTNRNSGIMDMNNDYMAHPNLLPSTNPSLAERAAVFKPIQYAAPYDV